MVGGGGIVVLVVGGGGVVVLVIVGVVGSGDVEVYVGVGEGVNPGAHDIITSAAMIKKITSQIIFLFISPPHSTD